MITSAKQAHEEIEQQILERSRVRALLRMRFSQDPESGKTQLQDSYQEPPLKVVRAFPVEDGAALIHLHNVSGGLLGGDHLTLQLRLERNASVQLATTSATRIYRREENAAGAIQRQEFCVGEEALLEYLPDATIPFAGSQYSQNTSIELAEGAGLFWWEILAPGREARGEVFAYEQLKVRTRISALGQMIAAENLCLNPAMHEVSSLARMGAYRYLATFYICRVGLGASGWRSMEEQVRELTKNLTRRGEMLWGVSSLVAHGLVVRCLARNGHEVLPGLQSIWRQMKRRLYDREAIPPRKVN